MRLAPSPAALRIVIFNQSPMIHNVVDKDFLAHHLHHHHQGKGQQQARQAK